MRTQMGVPQIFLRALSLCVLGSFLGWGGAAAEDGKDDSRFFRKWQRIEIPGALCGNGASYSVFLSDEGKDRSKIAFDFMGGGACWSAETCQGSDRKTTLFPMPFVLERRGFVSGNPEKSPFANHTMVFLPYCTGDVHIGDHVGDYAPELQVQHRGRENVRLTLAYLTGLGRIDLAHATDIVVYGYSAGALGAMFHAPAIDAMTRVGQNRVLIIDAPGLHFGPRFWEKFSPAMREDFSAAIRGVVGGGDAPLTGKMAWMVPTLCRKLLGWTIGVMQGSRDSVMSSTFGEITPEDHEKLVHSPEGILALTQGSGDHCSSWVPSTTQHTFLVDDLTALTRVGGKSAMDFARLLATGYDGENFGSRSRALRR